MTRKEVKRQILFFERNFFSLFGQLKKRKEVTTAEFDSRFCDLVEFLESQKGNYEPVHTDEQGSLNLREFLASSELRHPVKFRGVEISKMPRNVLEDVLAWAVTNGVVCG